MSYPNPLDVMVINDSDQEDSPQSCASSVVLLDTMRSILSTAHSGSATPRRGMSEPTPQHHDDPEITIRQRTTRSQPREIIVIDSDGPSDTQVRFLDRPHGMGHILHLQPRFASDDSDSDWLTPLPLEGEAWCQDHDVDNDGNGKVSCTSTSLPKVVHGSAVELRHIAAPKPDWTSTRKEFIWVTAGNHVCCLNSQTHL